MVSNTGNFKNKLRTTELTGQILIKILDMFINKTLCKWPDKGSKDFHVSSQKVFFVADGRPLG